MVKSPLRLTLTFPELAGVLLFAWERGFTDAPMGRTRDGGELLALALLNWQETTTSEVKGHDV